MEMNRRNFLRGGVGLAGMSLLPLGVFQNLKAEEEEPHFFLQIFYDGGWDHSYLFDARPLEMTQKNLIQNYVKEDPTLYAGSNGTSCLTHSLTAPLLRFKDHFSIVNGVHMSTSFDGHLQNVNTYFSGSPFGGEIFIPHLSDASQRKLLLDFLRVGGLFFQATNNARSIGIEQESAKKIAELLGNAFDLDPSLKLNQYIQNRAQMISEKGEGLFSRGAQQFSEGWKQSKQVSDQLKKLEIPDEQDEVASSLFLTREVFKNGIAKGVILSFDQTLDNHDPAGCANSPTVFASVVSQLAQVIEFLQETPFDERRNLLEVTTFAFCSEFGRTMRQQNVAIDQTGTDHNPLNNLVILGGKGIRGGQVIGQSDFRSAEETLSQAHLSLDEFRLKTMGKPFDFELFQPRDDKPEVYQIENYLNCASVANTIYECFGVPRTYFRELGRSGPVAPVLQPLLS